MTKRILGTLQGTVGDVTFRDRQGDTIVATKPNSFMPGTDALSVARRNRFGMAVKLSHAINYLSDLKHFWKLYGNEGSKFRTPFNKMVKSSYQTVTDTDITSTTSLVPEIGFEISSTNVTIADTGVTVALAAIGNDKGIDPVVEVGYQLACVVFLKSPTDEKEVPYYFIHQMSEEGVLSLTNPMTVTIDFDNITGQYFNKYTVSKGLFALITLDGDGQPVRYSNTIQSV
ncbi:MAG: hypothetical protein NTY74_10840 [Ignavibacteriae bacterium]|nr:hypothetical protein [Ignavibacteriota bacterium]